MANITTDPTTIPALVAGGIWIPGENVTDLGGGNTAWGSQASQTNSFTDVHTGNKPVLVELENGTSVWDYVLGGTYSSWLIPAPGSALAWTEKGSYAGWFRAVALDSAIHYFFAQWPGGATGNRINACKNSDNHRVAVNTSWNGGSSDAVSPPAIGDRAKWNSAGGPGLGPLVEWREWCFVRFTYDMSQPNFMWPPTYGGNFSKKLRVFVNEEELSPYDGGGTAQFSAPQPDVGGSPPDGPIRGINGVDLGPFALGADYVSAHWNGQSGPFYIAHGDEGLTEPNVWRRVMNWKPPT